MAVSIIQKYYSLKNMYLFSGIVLATIFISLLSNRLLINEIVFYNTYSEQLTWERSLKLFADLKNIAWVGYAFIPVILFIKFSLVTLVLYTGVFLFDLQKEITPGMIFRVVTGSEIIILSASLVKFLWFLFFAGNYTISDMSFFYPLALINIFRPDEVSNFWIFPLQMVNLFQLLYIISLSYGLYSVAGIKQSNSEKIVLTTYVPAIIFWMAFVMFLTVDTTAL